MTRGVFLRGIILCLFLCQLVAANTCESEELSVSIYAGGDERRTELHQGEAFLIYIEMNEQTMVQVRGTFAGKDVPFLPARQGKVWYALLGIDLNMVPGRYPIALEIGFPEGVRRKFKVIIPVRDREFPEEHLTLPRKMTELDEAALKRVRDDSAAFSKIWSQKSNERFLNGSFERPVPGDVTSGFGLRRVINGEPKSPHTGQDLRAASGEAVRAANAGRIVMVRDCFFSGKSVVIDHGSGIYSMYFHLSEYKVKPGDKVEKGQVIGQAGMTGRSTASHLHWGFRLLGARVNPDSVMALAPLLDKLQ